jgi:hypothetical protein
MTDYKKREDILKKMIETFVVPKYSDIEHIIVSSDFFRDMRRYNVIVLTNHVNDYPVQNKIIGEIETLFKMAALNEKQINGRDYIDISFA